MKWIFFFFIVSHLVANDNIEFLTMKFTSRASYQIEQTPYKKIAFTGINGDQLGKIDQWILQKLSTISDLELIRPNKSNPAVNVLLSIQGHTSNGLKKLKKLLGVQALLQGAIEMYLRKNLEVYFELYLYDLDTGVQVHAISRNWTIPVKSASRQVLYETAIIKILEEINQEWFSYPKIEEVPWFSHAHDNASKVIQLLKANYVNEALNLMENEKRKTERKLFKNMQSSNIKAKYQLILYHFGLLYEINKRFKLARQFYDLAIRHGEHSKLNVFWQAKRRAQRRW